MGVYCRQVGTHGNNDWAYSGYYFVEYNTDLNVYEGWGFWDPTGSLYTNYKSRFENIEDYYTNAIMSAISQGATDVGPLKQECIRKYRNLCQQMASERLHYEGYKMEFCDVGSLGAKDIQIIYENPVGSYRFMDSCFTIVLFELSTLLDAVPTVAINRNNDIYISSDYTILLSSDPVNNLTTAENLLLNTTPTEAYDPYQDPDVPDDYPNSFIETSNTIDDVIGSYLSAFTTIAEMDQTNLNTLGQALNNRIDLSEDLVTNINRIVRALVQKNIADGIISLKIVPIPKGESLPYVSGNMDQLFKPMGLNWVSGKKLNNTIKKFKIGEVTVQKIYSDYRDYLCEYSIYLPFSGIHRLDADLIVGCRLFIYVDIDFLTGSCMYHIVIDDTVTNRDVYQFTGDCGIELPITGTDYSAKYQSIMNGIFSGVGMVAGAVAGGPAGAMVGGAIGGVAGAGLKTVGNALSTKGNYIESGKLIPNASMKSVLYPYLIISKPQDVSPDYASVKGRPCHKMKTLSNCTGFTIVSNVCLDSIAYATDEDKDEIRSLLANGVYF